MDKPTVVHVVIGLGLALLSGGAWCAGGPALLSKIAIGFTDLYLLAVLVEAARRSAQERRIEQSILKPKERVMFEFPSRGWSLLQVSFLLFTAITGFANMYIKQGEVVYVGPKVAVHQEATDASHMPKPRLTGRLDAAYFSIVTITTLGYGDFLPETEPARMLVLWQLGTGLLLLIGIFPLLVARIADF